MKRPAVGDSIWEMTTKITQNILGEITSVKKSVLKIGVTGSIFPIWLVSYRPNLKLDRHRMVLRTAWIVKTGGRWFTTDKEEA